MSNLPEAARAQLAALVTAAYETAVAEGALPTGAAAPEVETPRDAAHGDWATGFALAAARTLRRPPRAIAEAVVARMEMSGSYFSSVEVAGAGFINARLSDAWYDAVLAHIAAEGDAYGRQEDAGQGRRVLVEFVSANPTGPMTIGNARGGVLGDTLAAVLDAAGCAVSREFYLNDAGHQVELFGASLEARYLQARRGPDACPFPEDGYHGDDIRVIAEAFAGEHGDAYVDAPPRARRDALIAFGLPKNIERMRTDLARYRIRYDRWFPESELHASGYVRETIDLLTARGHTYQKDGALWFRATAFGCDKDDVLQKSNGFYTYYAVDIAYHRDKFEKRGFDLAIDVLGADHHGHTLRFQAGMAALGIDPARLRFVLMQLVRLTRDGEVVRVSKRTGRAITLSDLLDEIPVDAARFFFNQRQSNTHLEFDMDLAVRTDAENPVYYVQYAHARISSLLKLLAGEGLTPAPPDIPVAACFTAPEERELLRKLADYPEEIRQAARAFEPAAINRYAVELAGCFHRFYNACRIRGAETETARARLAAAAAARQVLKNALTLLGISAPESM
ncbi:MAG: arginine--tRNA ligase [Oscillospiraceae bacterium]|jgi:arginyl-tRNA synthetase|nr:arginine--tRNA ligase [Oscillospiraceae bacterium]